MKRLTIYMLVFVVSGLFIASCSSEEELEPSYKDEIYFFVPEDATDDESVLRRDFYKETGIHLLFNDTLHTEYIGVDGFGDKVYDVEKVDLNYMQTSILKDPIRLEYFQYMDDKQAAVEFVKKHILSHLGRSLRPYSFLLVPSIEMYDDYYEEWNYQDIIKGWHCTAISLEGIGEMDEEEKNELKTTCLYSIVKDVINKMEYFREFYSYSNSYYGMYKEDLDIPEEYDDEQARQFGFLKDYRDYYYIYSDDDLEYFIQETVSTTEEEFTELYGEYPLIMGKYNTLKKRMESIGYVFNRQ